jgi:hypothetical protein
MFDSATVKLLLEEEEPTGAYPRRALWIRDPPTPVVVEVARWLPDDKPRWATRPLWLRAGGLDNHPAQGLLHAWVQTVRADWFGIVSVEMRSQRGQLRLVLPYQLIPEKALRKDTGPDALR